MVGEIELIGRCWWSNRNKPLGEFLQKLENEVKAQKSIVSDMIHRIGGKKTMESRAKHAAAWFAELPQVVDRADPQRDFAVVRADDVRRRLAHPVMQQAGRAVVALRRTRSGRRARDL